MQAALDAADHAALVMDARDGVGLQQAGASAVLRYALGVEMSGCCETAGERARWDPGLSGGEDALSIQRRVLQVTASSVGLPGEAAPPL